MGFCRMLLQMLWKNFLLRKRAPVWLAIEVLLSATDSGEASWDKPLGLTYCEGEKVMNIF